MRIALYTGRFFPTIGGSEIVVDALAREYLKSGHEVSVLCPRPLSLKKLADDKLPYRVIRDPLAFSKRGFLECRYRFLKKAQSAYKFEIIHAHAAFPECYLAARLKSEFSIPLIFTSHGADVCEDYRLYEETSIREKAKAAFLEVDIFCALNRELARDFLAFCGDKFQRVERVSNGVDSAAFGASKSGTKSGEPYMLFLARLNERKGGSCLIDAYARLKNKRAKLVIAGDGKERKNLQRKVREHGLEDRVIFRGEVLNEEKVALISNAEFLIVPTISWEACSLVVIEALAAAKPVIASNIQGIKHLLEKKGVGQLVEPGDVTGLEHAMTEYLEDPRRVAEEGRKARAFIEEFDWSRVAERYLDLYKSML